MAYSLRGGKPEIAEWFRENKNNLTRILDIGAGSGTYAKLLKEEFNLCKDSEWVAVEAWQPYVEKYQLEKIYNRVITQDVRTIDWDSLGSFSVTIAGDVLEHMNKEEAILLVKNILKHTTFLIISIPIVYMPQDEVDGNPFEVHVKPDWSHDEVIATWNKEIKKFYRKSPKSKIAVYWLSND